MMLRGHLDGADRERVRGWAVDDEMPDIPVRLVVAAGDTILGRVLANAHRPDLREAGIADGRCAFEFDLSGLLSPLENHLVTVRSELEDTHLQGSPVLVERSGAFDDVKTAFAEIISAYETDEDLDTRLSFLAERTDVAAAASPMPGGPAMPNAKPDAGGAGCSPTTVAPTIQDKKQRAGHRRAHAAIDARWRIACDRRLISSRFSVSASPSPSCRWISVRHRPTL